MIGRRSVILEEADRWLFHLVLLVSLYVAFRGHNAPGGGFAGGLVAGCAFVLRFFATGRTPVWRSGPIRPASLIGAGLAVAVITATVPLVVGESMLESAIWKLHVPLVGDVKVVSSALFDMGVYLLVVGVVLAMLTSLGADEEAAA